MTDIIANILARLAALEQGVAQCACADHRPRRRLPTVAVAQRYNVVPRTIDRWAKAPELDFPAAEVINRRRYWDEDALDAWDQARIRSSVSNAAAARLRTSRKMPVLETNLSAKPRQQKDQVAANTNTLEEAAAPLRPMGSGWSSEAFAAEHRSSPTKDRVTGEPTHPRQRQPPGRAAANCDKTESAVPSDAASAGYGRDPTPSTTAQPSHPPDPGNERRHDMRNRQCSQRRRR
jgi:hypothetical protein